MLKAHHLGHSQSERIVWLCEERGLDYELRQHTRDPITMLSPPELQALHPPGAAPVFEDGDWLLAELAAIVEYLIVKHGGGRLKLGPEHPDHAAFLSWFHFANGNLQPVMGRLMTASRAKLPTWKRDCGRACGLRLPGLPPLALAGAGLTCAATGHGTGGARRPSADVELQTQFDGQGAQVVQGL